MYIFEKISYCNYAYAKSNSNGTHIIRQILVLLKDENQAIEFAEETLNDIRSLLH